MSTVPPDPEAMTKAVPASADGCYHRQFEQDRLALAVEQAPETVILTDPAGTIVYVNPAFEQSTGYTRTEALGQNPRILKSGQQDAEFYRNMWAVLTAGKVWRGRLINRRRNGTLYVEEAMLAPIRDATGALVYYMAAKRDVTGAVEREAQQRQADKMEAVGRLAGGLAHDFNNKLQIILGCVEMLLQDLQPDHPFHANLLNIQETSRRAADLTRQLMTIARQQAMAPVALDLNAAIPASWARTSIWSSYRSRTSGVCSWIPPSWIKS